MWTFSSGSIIYHHIEIVRKIVIKINKYFANKYWFQKRWQPSDNSHYNNYHQLSGIISKWTYYFTFRCSVADVSLTLCDITYYTYWPQNRFTFYLYIQPGADKKRNHSLINDICRSLRHFLLKKNILFSIFIIINEWNRRYKTCYQ